MRLMIVVVSLVFSLTVAADTWTVSPFQPEVQRGGRAVAVAVNPTDARIAIVASESGGLFMTSNDGASWSHIDAVRPLRMADVAYAPGRGDIVIATAQYDLNSVNPIGIWRSTDGGRNWTQPVAPGGCFTGANTNAYGISFEPGSNRVVVATDCGLLVSNDLGATWASPTAPPDRSQMFSVKAVRGGVVYACTPWDLWRMNLGDGRWMGPAPSVGGCSGLDGDNLQAIDVSPFEPDVVFFINDRHRVFESDDGGTTWTRLTESSRGRPGWLKASQVRTDGFELHYGNGVQTFRQVCRSSGPGTRCSPGWTEVGLPHADSNHMAYHPSTGCAQYVVTDGGIHRNAPRTTPSSPCPSAYTWTGNGSGGYHALQFYEVTTQRQATGWTDDLYFGTQDNDLYASTDGGRTWPGRIGAEGFALEVAPHASNPGADTVVGVACADCYPFKSSRGFAARSRWNAVRPYTWRPPGATEDVSAQATNSFLLAPGVHAMFAQVGLSDLRVFTTRNQGRDWTDAGRLPLYEIRSRPQVAGPRTNPSVFVAFKRPGTNQTAIARVDDILSGRASWLSYLGGVDLPEDIDGYCMGDGSFGCPLVFAVNPRNPLHIMLANANGEIWVTRDGYRWTRDDILTGALRGTGATATRLNHAVLNRTVQAHTIAFHPRNAEIFVGTESQGIFFSEDDGRTWRAVQNSRQVHPVSGFAFGFDGDRDREVVYVSTYGRGLWKLRRVIEPRLGGGGGGGMQIRWVPFPETLFDPWARYVAMDPRTGGPLRFPIGPDDCPVCVLALVEGGRVRDLKLSSDFALEGLASDGKLIVYQATGQPAQLQAPVAFAQADGAFEGCPSCLTMVKEGATLGGAVIENGKVIGLLALFPGDEQPPPQPLSLTSDQSQPGASSGGPSGPYVLVTGTVPGTGIAAITPNDALGLLGTGFCGKPECGPLVVKIGGEVVPAQVKMHLDGSFEGTLRVPETLRGPGPHAVTVGQQVEGQMIEDVSRFVVTRREAEETAATPPSPAVLSATLRADPADYSGPCPVTIRFTGEVTGAAGTSEVVYTFLRSDGATAPTAKVAVAPDGTASVATSWTLSTPSYSGWQAIQILSPKELKSNEAKFTVQCQ